MINIFLNSHQRRRIGHLPSPSSITCSRFAIIAAAALLLQSLGLSLFIFGFFPTKLALSGVSGPESFRAPWPNGVGNDSAAALPPEELKRLYQELSEISPPFDRLILMILHYLGVDHVGHLGGRNSFLMGPKLKEMDEVIEMIHPSSLRDKKNYQTRTLLANDARKDLYDKEKELQDVKQEVLGLKQALKDANYQCVLLFNEVQKAWKVSYTLQSNLKSENIMLADKHKIEKGQNAQLRNQLAQLAQLEQAQKLQIQEQDSTIHSLQVHLI